MNKTGFKSIVAAVMSTLAISAFAKDSNGKSMLTSDQMQALTARYGEKFLSSFETDLKELESEEGVTAEAFAQSMTDAERTQIAQQNDELIKLRDENKSLLAKIDAMGKSPAATEGEELLGAQGPSAHKTFKPDMKLVHNQAYIAAANGDAWTGDTTVDTTELQREFGKYVSTEKREIFNKLVGQVVSTKYMSTIITDKFEVSAGSAQITSVLQTFTPKFTPKGKTTFTPLKIKSFPMKINVSIIPSDVINDVIGYLYDEGLEPKDMPIVRYIVEKLVKPILDEEREIALAVGRYTEPKSDSHGSFVANGPKEVCDGYLTQLSDLKKASDTDVTWLLTDTADLAGDAQIVEKFEKAMDAIKPLYKNQKMMVHIDPDLLIKYQRAYRAKYPYTKNEDGQRNKVDFTPYEFAEMEGMRGTGAFFLTPKNNFKHLLSRQPQSQKLRMATVDYEARIYGEWREGTGFWIKEAIFAYLPAALVEKLSPSVLAAASADDSGLSA